jgi:hypothetical protein
MKWVIRILLILVVIFIILQFFRPERITEEITEDHLFEQEDVPEEIRSLLVKSCLDCHSMQTRYLWYHRIMPASYLVNNHITEGREDLNLSYWGKMEQVQQLTALDKMCEEVENGNMPLKSYLLMHPGAKFSDEEKEIFCNWIENMNESILIKMIE